MNEESGGLAVVSIGFSPWLLLLVLAIIVFVGIKLLKFFWLMFESEDLAIVAWEHAGGSQ